MNLWVKIKVWTKAAVLAFVLIYVISFIAKNTSNTAMVWYWYGNGGQIEGPTLVFAFFSFVAGVLLTLFVRMLIKTVRQFRDMRTRTAAVKRDRDIDNMMAKAAKLQTRDDATSI